MNFPVTIDHRKSIEQLVQDCQFTWKCHLYDEESQFLASTQSPTVTPVTLELVSLADHLENRIGVFGSPDKVIALLTSLSMRGGDFRELLALRLAYFDDPRLQDCLIIAPGTVWTSDEGYLEVPYLELDSQENNLGCHGHGPEDWYDHHDYILAVKL